MPSTAAIKILDMTDMTTPTKIRHKAWLQLLVAIVTVLAINGAIPFLTMPTMGQAVWSLGFSQSFANQSIFAIHAINFGQPHPAAIAFGLSGAYPASLLLRLGFAPADAYTIMFAAWLMIAFFGARQICIRGGLTTTASNLCAVMWLSLPMVWMHVDYSMLSLGMALMPFYFLALLRLVDEAEHPFAWSPTVAFVCMPILSVFMDGYTFVMFATASAAYVGLMWLRTPSLRRRIAVHCIPVVLASFALAYVLYAIYLGHAQFQSDPIEVFRAWGVDLGFIMLPTWGIQWLPDLLHFETRRIGENNFGDASVWNTTFSLPLILFAAISWFRLRKRYAIASTFLVIALLGGYMALGPSLKIFSVRHAALSAETNPASMPASSAVLPTGSSRLSIHLPGLRNMRASYRWLTLGLLGCWLLVVLAFGVPTSRCKKIILYVAALLVVCLNLPHTLKRLNDGHIYRVLFEAMDTDLQKDLARTIPANSKVAFLPWGNDFLVNYLAARAKLRALNIGGDKNLAEAIAYWPQGMSGYTQGTIDPQFTNRLLAQLTSREIDAAVIPYFDALWSAHFWPCASLMKDRASSYVRSDTRELDDACPDGIRRKLASTVGQFSLMPALTVEEHAYFAVVKLADGSMPAPPSIPIRYPVIFGMENPAGQTLLRAGWLPPEDGHVWSGPEATLDIPLTAPCRRNTCVVTLVFNALAASAKRNVELHVRDAITGKELACVDATGPNTYQVQATVRGKVARLRLVVPAAVSPAQINLGPDQRVLGIALLKADVLPGNALPGDAKCSNSQSAR